MYLLSNNAYEKDYRTKHLNMSKKQDEPQTAKLELGLFGVELDFQSPKILI